MDIPARVNEMVSKANRHLEASQVDIRLKIFCINPLPGFAEKVDYLRMLDDFSFTDSFSYPGELRDTWENATSELVKLPS